MSKERELLKRVISGDDAGDFFIDNSLYKDIDTFLAQPEQTEQEQAGYLYKQKDCYGDWGVKFSNLKPYMAWHEIKDIVPVYTRPPKREPLPLTQTEAYKRGYSVAVKDLKAKIDNIFAGLGVE